MSIRADYELEPLPIRTVIMEPVATPDISVVDFNQAGVGHAIKVGSQRMWMGNDHRPPGGEQPFRSCIIRCAVAAMKDVIVEAEIGSKIHRRGTVDFGSSEHTQCADALDVCIVGGIGEMLEVIADADDLSMANARDQLGCLLGHYRAVLTRKDSVNVQILWIRRVAEFGHAPPSALISDSIDLAATASDSPASQSFLSSLPRNWNGCLKHSDNSFDTLLSYIRFQSNDVFCCV
jgi:hypothetical protein